MGRKITAPVIRTFDTPPVVGQWVEGTSVGAGATSRFGGVYEGVRPSEWDDHEDYHFLRGGFIGTTSQGNGLHGFPVAQTATSA